MTRRYAIDEFYAPPHRRTQGLGPSAGNDNVRHVADLSGDIESPLSPEELASLPERVRIEGAQEPTPQGGRSEWQREMSLLMVGQGVPDSLHARALRDSVNLPRLANAILIKDGKKRPDPVGYIRKQIEGAHTRVQQNVGPEKRSDGRIAVRNDESNLTKLVEEVERNLVASGLPIYRNEEWIVHAVRFNAPKDSKADKLGRHDDGQGIRRVPGTLLMRAIPRTRLLEHIDSTMAFYVPKKNGIRWVAAPRFLTEHIMNRTDESEFKILNGIIEAPTITADGLLLKRDGYDERSGLILDLGGVEYPDVPDAPTFDQGRAGLDALLEPLDEFPFVSDREDGDPSPSEPSAARSVALAAILTSVVRKSLGPTPLFGFSASTPGTGKSILADVVANLATGRSSSALAVPSDDGEFEKRIHSAVRGGGSMLTLDNVTRPLTGDALCQLVERESMEIRPMGQNANNIRISPKMTTMATGNGLKFAADMNRRGLLCGLDARVENPERRDFKRKDLVGWVRKNRPRLVAAALTVLRAYDAAGRPSVESLSNFGSFEGWSAWIRNALVWLGEPDPVLTIDRIKEADPDRDTLGTLLNAIAATDFGQPNSDGTPKWFTALQLLDVRGAGTEVAKQLNVAMWGLNGRVGDEPPSAKGLGRYLASKDKRIVDGLEIIKKKDRTGLALFALRYAGGRTPAQPQKPAEESHDAADEYAAQFPGGRLV